ncbi:MAG: SDR family oxidoreductase [Lentisphaeria bacterium]|nr:MAG: SDR family oxidoreductase [Lentisphaeria bacterium]
MNFLEKIAVVTGGADGIGRQLVIELAECGTEVFFCGRRPDASEVLDKCCGHGHYFMCDIANEEDIRRFISNTLAFKGSIDYLVNNVASDDRNSFEEVTPEKI